MDAQARRAQELLRAVLDETCSDAERAEFQDLLSERPQLAEGMVDEVFIHSLLTWQSEDITECMDLELAASQMPCEAVRRPSSAPRLWTWALAVSLLLASGVALRLGAGGHLSKQAAGDGAIAELVDEEGVFWSNSSTALREGRFIVPGKLETNAGAYTLKFRSGPTMHVAGGSSLRVESDMLVRLDRGQATADVPESGVGFTIKTPVINVIDLGTQFGVAVGETGKTDVVVFEGKVDLQEDGPAPPKQLVRGEGVSIRPDGAMNRLMQIQRDVKWGWWTPRHPDTAANVIEEVSDNIPTSDGTRYYCYQITFRGLEDDAFAYADHAHQWNGLTSEGLPKFLRGADYVKTFNDYRYLADFKMRIKLTRPAHLYLFFDNRVPLPAWVEEQFEDTGVDIGLDEGPWPTGDRMLRPDLPERVNALGGGESIDNSFSVWHRRCEDGAPVTLGPVGETSEARAMYGFAATPLE